MLPFPSVRTSALAVIGSSLACMTFVLVGSAEAQRGDRQPAPVVDDVSWINQLVEERWKESEIKPSAAATDGEFVRRAYLDIVGHTPPAAKAKEYIDSRDKDKKAKLIVRLLEDENYPKYWATIWSNLLIGRSPGREIDRPSMLKYLRDSFAENRPWNKMVYELVTASGGNTPKSTAMGVPFNGATNFMLSHINDGRVPATSFTTRLFLGMQIQCTQCHDHPFNDRKQESFWGINAFLQRMQRREFNDVDDTGRRIFLFAELSENTLDENSDLFVRFDKRSALVEVTPPLWIDGETRIIEPTPGMNLRERLAELITDPDNPYFAQAIVNRMWAHFLGRGIVHPLDDLGEHNPPSNPELLERLADHFKESNYDLKRLITWITLSAPYALSSQTNPTNKEDDALFSHYPLKQMSPEQFFDSIMIASQANEAGAKGWEQAEKMKEQLQRQFTTVFSNDENAEADSFNGTIPQALLLMNGELMAKATSIEKGSYLRERVEEIVKSNVKAQELALTKDLYLAALSRYPTQREISWAAEMIKRTVANSNPKNPQEMTAAKLAAFQDVFWALLNSSEFVLNH